MLTLSIHCSTDTQTQGGARPVHSWTSSLSVCAPSVWKHGPDQSYTEGRSSLDIGPDAAQSCRLFVCLGPTCRARWRYSSANRDVPPLARFAEWPRPMASRSSTVAFAHSPICFIVERSRSTPCTGIALATGGKARQIDPANRLLTRTLRQQAGTRSAPFNRARQKLHRGLSRISPHSDGRPYAPRVHRCSSPQSGPAGMYSRLFGNIFAQL